jgi:hypothetical protein
MNDERSYRDKEVQQTGDNLEVALSELAIQQTGEMGDLY